MYGVRNARNLSDEEIIVFKVVRSEFFVILLRREKIKFQER